MVGPITNYISGMQRVAKVPYEDTKDFPAFAAQVRMANKDKLTPRRRIAGFAVLMPKGLYQQVEGFDDAFGIGNFEDDDLCVKVREAGYAIIVHEGVYLHHFGHKSFIANKVDYKRNIESNGAKFKAKWPNIDYDELLEMKNPINEMHPNLYMAGMEYLENGEFEAAFKIMDQLVKDNPLYEDALVGLAMSAKALEMMEVAITTVSRLLHVNPNNAIAYNLSGMLAAESGNMEGATKLFKLAMDKDQSFLDAHRNYAEVLLMGDAFQEGVEVLLNILNKNPKDIPTLLRLVQLNLEAERNEDALELAKKIITVDPEEANALRIIESLEK